MLSIRKSRRYLQLTILFVITSLIVTKVSPLALPYIVVVWTVFGGLFALNLRCPYCRKIVWIKIRNMMNMETKAQLVFYQLIFNLNKFDCPHCNKAIDLSQTDSKSKH